MKNIINSRLSLATLIVAASVGGCFVDDDAPGAPVLDDVRTVTSLDTVHIAGSAEPLAHVTLTGGDGDFAADADGVTGRFAADVALKDGDNAIAVVANDADGNASEATTVTVKHEPARAEVVRVALEDSVVDADVAALVAVVDIDNNESEIDLSTLGVTITIADYAGAFTALPVTVDAAGHARVILAGLTVKGTGRVVAEADVADLDGVKAKDEAAFTIVAGAPATVDVTLATDAIAAANAISVVAGTDVDVAVVVKDQHANLIEGGTIALDVPGGGVDVAGNRLVGVETAGVFTVVANTGTGLLSGTATLTVTAAAPDHVDLALDASLVEAGTVVVAEAAAFDAFGNLVSDVVPTITSTAPQSFGAATNNNGVVTAPVTVTAAGSYIVTATAAGAAFATAALDVVAATPANANFFEIDAAGLPYAAGDAVFFNYELTDAFGNVNSAVPVLVTVNAPNVAIVDGGNGTGEIDGIVRSGTYTVRARAIGTGLPDDVETLTIDPNPEDAGFNLLLSAGLIAEQGTLLFFATDGFGNNIDAADVAVTISDPTAATQTGNRLVFTKPGTFGITACLVADSSICDTEFLSVQGLLDTVPPSVAVSITFPDPAQSSVVPTRGLVTFSVDSTDDRGLSEIRFVATFGTSAGTQSFCSVTRTGVLLASGTLQDSRTFSFQLPTCALPLDDIRIVAQAIDQAGNSSNSSDHTPLTVASTFNLTSPGFIVEVAAFNGNLDGIRDVAVDAATGQLFLANFNNDRISVVAPDRTQQDLRDSNGNRLNPAAPRGVALDANNALFIVADDAGNGRPGIERLDANFIDTAPLIDSATTTNAFPNRGEDLDIDQSVGLTGLMCAAVDQVDRVQCFTNFDATPALTVNQQITGRRPIALEFDPPSATSATDRLWVALNNGGVAVRPFDFNATRTTLTAGTDLSLAAQFQNGDVGDLVVAPSGNLIITNARTGVIVRVDRNSGALTEVARGFQNPRGLAFDGDVLYVVDSGDAAVFRISPDPAAPGVF